MTRAGERTIRNGRSRECGKLLAGICEHRALSIDATWSRTIKYAATPGRLSGGNSGAQLKTRLRQLAAFLLVGLTVFGLFAKTTNADDLAIKVRVQDQVKDTTTGKTKKQPVPGVKVVVLDAAGATVGEGVTDAKGVATVSIRRRPTTPSRSASTLPSGAALTEANEKKVTESSFVTSTVTVNYFIGKADRASIGRWSAPNAWRTVPASA